MKESLCNNIGIKLIQQKGFSIIDTSLLPASILKYSLYKEKWGAYHIVNFMDADAMANIPDSSLTENISREISALKNIGKGLPLVYFKVFVTLHGLPGYTMNNIMSAYSHSIPGRTTFIPMVLDMAASRLYSSSPGMDKVGISQLITDSLYESAYYPDFDYLGDVYRKSRQGSGINSTMNRVSTKPYVTYMLIATNLLMFAVVNLAEMSGDRYALIRMGAKVNQLIVMGEYWRLLTSAFLHAGIAHIAFNMYGLYNTGPLVERLFGSKKCAFIYFSSALLGSLCSFAFSKAPSVGASGAIFGLFGALIYIWKNNRNIFSQSFGINILIVVGFNIVNGLANTGIDNFAHIGGLIGGYISASASGLSDDRGFTSRKAVPSILLAVLFISLLVYGIWTN